MIWRKLLNRLKNKKIGIGTYIVEISLIIFSILIAIQADRCNQNRKDDTKLQAYLEAMHQDLLDEQGSNQNNLTDCNSDLESLEQFLRLSRYNQNDSLDLALQHIRRVFSRGVFRTFPPTTFDIMMSTGDISLIKDLTFRNRLAATFSFRDSYIQNDLKEFDAQVKTLAQSMGQYIDLACMTTSGPLHACLVDRTGLVENNHNEVFLFLRMAQVRAFHLSIAIQNFDKMIKIMEQEL